MKYLDTIDFYAKHILDMVGIVKDVIPLHDNKERKFLMENWVSKYSCQPLDAVRSYFGDEV